MAALGFLFALTYAPIFSAIQSLVNDHMRSVAIALIFLLANLIGFGLGPLAVGLMSDLLALAFGQDALRYALVSFTPGFVWVGYYYWKAGKTIEADIRSIESHADSAKTKIDTSSENNLISSERINVSGSVGITKN